MVDFITVEGKGSDGQPKTVELAVSDGAALVSQAGFIPVGSSFSAFGLQVGASGALSATPVAPEFMAGLAAKEIYLLPADVSTGIIVGWSYSDNDAGSIKTQMEGLNASTTGTVDTNKWVNTMLLSAKTLENHNPLEPIVAAIPGDTIKTIAFMNTAAATMIQSFVVAE